MPSTPEIATPPAPKVSRMVGDIIRCKWSLTVLALVRGGVKRPGAMERSVPGLSAKVLNERLRKLVRYGILSRKERSIMPPHVEYHLTPFGRRFCAVLRAIERLEPSANGG